MIFPTSSENTRPIAPALRSRVQEIEEGQPGLYVLAAREFRYPVQQQELSIHAEQYRRMNLLEKFMLQAYTEIVPRPPLEELAEALGLDPIFIKNTFQDLISMQSLAHGIDGPRVTDEGRQSLRSETITEPPLDEIRYLIQDPVLGTRAPSPFRLRAVKDDFEDLSPYVDLDLHRFPALNFDDNELQAYLQEWNLDLHDPAKNRFVTAITPTSPPEIGWRPLSVFILYDTLQENPDEAVTFEVRSFENKIVPQVGAWLEAQLQQRNLSLKTLCGLLDEGPLEEEELSDDEHIEELPIEPEVEERLVEIRQQATTHLRLQREGQITEAVVGTSLQLRDSEIRPAFLKALQESQELIIIYSPWMNEQVVDDEFIALLKRQVQKGVRILIGYGIGRIESREDRPVSPELLQRLQEVQTPEGTPGIIAEWLGNSHAKEVIVDRKVHFSGSHNWLSYRGDRFPRGETVYQVTLPTEVEKAYHYLAQRFIEHAEKLWNTSDEERRLALCILTTLGYEQQAIEWIERDGYYDFIPCWLKLAAQGISVDRAVQIIAALHIAVTLCCTAVDKQSDLMSEITVELKKVFKRLAVQDQQLTLAFIDNNLVELKQLELYQYIRDISTVTSREQNEKKSDHYQGSDSRQESTQRRHHNRNRARGNR